MSKLYGMPQPCEFCGGKDFTLRDGFYICNNCNTQSQDIEEQTFEYLGDDTRRNENEDEIREEKTKQENEGRLLTSWECYNFVLRGLIDELIKLGASEKLKIVAFQLWASYLSKANIAFFSKAEGRLPSLPIGFSTKDVEILYGIHNLRKTLFDGFLYPKRKVHNPAEVNPDTLLNAVASDFTFQRYRRKQRKIASSEIENDTSGSEEIASNVSVDTITENEQSTSKNKVKNVAFKPSARKALNEIFDIVKSAKKLPDDKEASARAVTTIKRRMFDSKRYNKQNQNMPVNMTTLLSVLQVALLIIGDNIHLGDLLRWIIEGRLSANQPEKFIPNPEINQIPFKLRFCNRPGFQLGIKNFTYYLNLSQIPSPNMYNLVEKYCVELCLPYDFKIFVCEIIKAFPPEMNYALYNFRVFPDYECRALAYIIFAFKLLFSLDGVTELYQSEFADSVNNFIMLNNLNEIPLLFSWMTWVRYIECRKAVLAKYNINQFTYGERINNEDVFPNYWEKTKPMTKTTFEKISTLFVSILEEMLHKINNKSSKKKEETINIEFPPSVTPQLSETNYLLEHYSELISNKTRFILAENFTSHSVKYLINQNWCTHVAENCKLCIEFVDGIAIDKMQKFKFPDDGIPTIGKFGTVPAWINTCVDIEDDTKKYKIKKKKKLELKRCKRFQPQFTVFDSSNNTRVQTSQAENEQQTVEDVKIFKIYNPSSNMWFFHEIQRSIERFNAIAESNFSDSFIWLLDLCASLVHAEVKELYSELIIVENALSCMFYDSEFAKNVPVPVFPNEW